MGFQDPMQPEPVIARLVARHHLDRSVQLPSNARVNPLNQIEQRLGDQGRIRQLLNNLLTNSLEALDGRENPVIMIETQRSGGQVSLVVIDNGPGFQGGLLQQAFDPYVTSKPKGTGLGLAIVRRIIEEHGGAVEVDNAPQGGARVRITLPATARETRRAEARREKA